MQNHCTVNLKKKIEEKIMNNNKMSKNMYVATMSSELCVLYAEVRSVRTGWTYT